MMTWLPVEKAPKDGSRMLLSVTMPDGTPFVCIGGFDNHWTGKCWVTDGAPYLKPRGWVPDAWMPLPTPFIAPIDSSAGSAA
jgi:hypothetical protein